MKTFERIALFTGALSAAILGAAPTAVAAPSGPGTAQCMVDTLSAEGYTVIVNKLGSAPLDHSTVTAVRLGQQYSRTDSGVPGVGHELAPQSPTRRCTWT